jgi:hypothetical protein
MTFKAWKPPHQYTKTWKLILNSRNKKGVTRHFRGDSVSVTCHQYICPFAASLTAMLLGYLVHKLVNYELPDFGISREVYLLSVEYVIPEKPIVTFSSSVNNSTCYLFTIVCSCRRALLFVRVPRIFLCTLTKVQSAFPTQHLNWHNTILISALPSRTTTFLGTQLEY